MILIEDIVMRPIPGLEELVELLPNDITMIEIGSFAGESTEIFIRSGKIKKIICIDPWNDEIFKNIGFSANDIYKRFKLRLSYLKDELGVLPSIGISKRLSVDAAPLLEDNAYDFVYIDGDHTKKGVQEDIRNYLPKLKPNGILAGHDYYPNDQFKNNKIKYIFPDVPIGVDEMIGKPDKIFPDTSWMKYVKNINKEKLNDIIK